MKDSLGDRQKEYEKVETSRLLIPRLPIVVRIDGRAFHSFARGLTRPFDERLTQLMIETTKFLVHETNARIGYTQSDEISLILFGEGLDSETFFNRRTFKLTSMLASMATGYFNSIKPHFLPEKADKLAFFDCLVWNVSSKEEAVNYLIWREWDATKNSVSMAAQSKFSHKKLQNKNAGQMQEMLFQEFGINWNDYPAFFKRGTYVQRKIVTKKLSIEEIDKLPAKHAARKDPNLEVLRGVVEVIEVPRLASVKNRVEMVFDGENPRKDE